MNGNEAPQWQPVKRLMHRVTFFVKVEYKLCIIAYIGLDAEVFV